MKPSMWTHARICFAVMQIIAYANWEAVSCWLVWVQLYCQTYLTPSPCIAYVPSRYSDKYALIIGRINVVYIFGAFLASVGPFGGLLDLFFALRSPYFAAVGTFLTGCANIYFAVIDPSVPYWPSAFRLLAPSFWARILRSHQGRCSSVAAERTEHCG